MLEIKNGQELNIGLCGLGTVGQGILELLQSNSDLISQRSGCTFRIVRVASRTEKKEVELHGAEFSTRLQDLVEDDRINLIIEAIGGEDRALELIRAALEAGKHVVTANKALIAQHGNELIPLAQSKGLFLGYEAAVAGGIPILKALKEGLAGNRIHSIVGIINGTSNYILSAMTHDGDDFQTALDQAQALGYAEADPTFDIEGVDAAHKLTILASLAFAVPMHFSSVYLEGISSITVEDIQFARSLGYRIKHLGICSMDEQGLSMRVHPALVPDTEMLAGVEGVRNAVQINSDALGSSFYLGPGAGALPTASSIVADLVDLARGNTRAMLCEGETKVLGIDDITSAYYLRIPALDRPGVLAELTQALSSFGISIEALTQREQDIKSDTDAAWVPVIIITHRVREAILNNAISSIQESPDIVGDIMRIRVDSSGKA